MGWNPSPFAANAFGRYLARLRKLLTGAGLKVAQYVRPRKKQERPTGSTVMLELGTMEGRESFNPVGQLGMAIGGAAALGALIHQLASAPASSPLAEVLPGNEDGTSGQWEGHPQEFVVGAASDYPTVSYAGWQPASAQPGEDDLAQEFDNFFSAAGREPSGGGVPAGDAGGGGGGDPVTSGGPGDGRSAEQPFAGGAERQSDPSGLDQSMANVAPPAPATTPATLDAGTQIAPLPPIAMAQMPFAGTGATFEAMGAMPQVPSPGSTSSGIVFTPNRGQADPEARFVAHAPGFDLALAPDRVTFDVGQFRGIDQIHMEFVGANESPEMIGVSPVTATAGPALLGGLGAMANTGQGFSQVNYQNLYNGINLDFYVNAAGKVEHDFVVAAGADPNSIRVSYAGADRLELDGQNNLHIYTATSGLVQRAPVAYQQYGGVFEPVRVNYVLEGNTVTFGLGAYDPTRTLVIDPVSDVLTPSGTFRAPVVGSAGSTPNSAVAADFDNDGDDDALIANFNGANLTLALSNGNGTFATGVSIAAGNGANGLAVGDITGNGEKDILVSNYYDNTVGVIRSNGDGTFQSMVTYAVGGGPANTALGDFDGDGHLDIATANHGAGTVSVLLNNGDGTFASAVSYTAQSGTIGIAAVDLDGDEIVDLAAANYGSSSVSVFIGNGDGTFATGVNYSVGANPFYLAAGDFRQDGFPDLVTANFGSNTVSRLTNNGDGTFASAVNTTVGSSPTSLAVGDLYGRPTLVVGNFGSSDVSLLLTNPDGSFQTEQRFAAGVTGPNGMALGDFKGDGKLSVLVGGESSGTFAVLLNGTVQATQGVSFTGPVAWFTDSNSSVPASAFTATIDWGDGNTSTGTVQADPAGGFVVIGTHTYENGSYPITVDIEEAGPGASTTAYNLAIVTDFLEPTVEVFGTSLSTTEGTALSNVVVATFTDPGGAEALSKYSATIDWGDGSAVESGTITYDSGTGVFSVKGSHTYAHHDTYLAAVHVTNHGHIGDNLAIVTITEAAITTTGMFQPPVSYGAGDAPAAVAAADFDHDGKQDVLVANSADGELTLAPGNGDGTFGTGVTITVGNSPSALAVGDLAGPAASDLSSEIVATPDVGTETVWVEDGTPAGATLSSSGGDSWTWVTSSPTPFSGSQAHQSNTASGEHQHYFTGATSTLSIGLGDKLFAYVYLDPTNTPTEVMLQWHDTTGSWDHRAYWGANNINWGTDGTNSRRFMGALPTTGGWVRLEVDASLVGLEGKTLDGMAFTLYDGKATWDKAGVVEALPATAPGLALSGAGDGQVTLTWTKSYAATSYNIYRSTTTGGQGSTPYATGVTTTSFSDTSVSNGTDYYYTVTAVTPAGESAQSSEIEATPASGNDTIWIEDGVPAGATLSSSGGDTWTWVDSTLFSGSQAHQSIIGSGTHQHYFTGATNTLSVGTGDSLFAYVFLDPANPPTEVMLQWHDTTNSWDHRAYWGANSITFGTDGTNSRRYMGDLPVTGGWVRLEVPASLVGLEGVTVDGMAFTLYGGRATWDYAGKGSNEPALTPPGLAASPGDDQVTLRWTATPGATNYNIYRATTSGGQGSTPYAANVTGTSYIDTNVSNGTDYYYKVVAVQAATEKDIVVVNAADDTVGVLRNNGDGTFATMVTYAVGDNPGGVVLADFDGDQKLDIATANSGAGTVSVLLNNGDGTFASAVSYTAGSGAKGIVAADLDGDDVIDLAVANTGANSVTVFIGNGDGTFATGVTYAVGNSPVAIAAGDFRDDGFPDLVTANSGADTISRLVNNGDGTFATAVSIDVGDSPSSVTVAALNGRPSVIVGNAGSDDVSVFLVNTDGSFQDEERFDAGNGPSGVALADFNGDGKADIATADAAGDTFSVLLNSSLAPTSNQFFTGKVGSFSSANPLATAETFSATIDWGDGTDPGPAMIVANGSGGFDVYGSHFYEDAGDYTVTASVSGSFFTIRNLANVLSALLPTGDFSQTVVTGQKFLDSNGNGVRDSGESGLSNWTMKLFVSTLGILATTPVATTVTDANGSYTFTSLGALSPGQSYVVVETAPDGWKQTRPIQKTPNAIVLGNGLVGYVVPPVGGVPFQTVSGSIIGLAGTGSVTLNALNNSTTGTIHYNDGVNSGTLNAHVSQFNVTYNGGPGTPITFDTFCIDVFHTVTTGQTYLVDPRGDLASAFTNGSRIAYVYQNFGTQNLSGDANEAAAVQLVLWYLSLGTTPSTVSDLGGGVWGTSDGAFSFEKIANISTVAARFNALVTASTGSILVGAWLDASPSGSGSGRGQHLLLPLAQFNFGNQTAANSFKFDSKRWSDDQQSTYVPKGTAWVSPTTGAVMTYHPLCLDCGCPYCNDATKALGNPMLVYNSATVLGPTVRGTFNVPPGVGVPTSFDVSVTWDGGTVTRTLGAGHVGDNNVFVQLDATGVSEGIRDYTMTITAHFPAGRDIAKTATGKVGVVNNRTSPFGAGWNIDRLYRLAFTSNDVLLIRGDGNSRMFFYNSSNPSVYTRGDENESGQLTSQNGQFIYREKDGTAFTFDSNGRLLDIRSPAAPGKPMAFTYDSNGTITTLKMPDGKLTNFAQGSGGRINAIQAPGSRTYTLSQTGSGSIKDLTTITNPDGGARGMTYNGAHVLKTDPWGPLDSSHTIDPVTNLVTAIDVGEGDTLDILSVAQKGLTSTTPLSSADLVATTTDALNRTTTYTLDNLGRLSRLVTPDGAVQTWLLNAGGYAVRYADELGRVTQMAYDSLGNLLGAIQPDDSSFHFTYDNTFHNVTSYTDTLDRVTTYRYNPSTGDLLRRTDALGGVMQQVWSGGLLMSVADELGRRTRFRYFGERELLSETDPLGNRTSYTYDAAGNLETVTDALGRVTSMVYDGMRRVVEITDANGGTVTMTYDAIGDLTSQTDQLGRRTDYVYSQRGFLISITEAVGTSVERTSSSDYDVVGNLLSAEDALDRVTSFAYDVRDRVTEVIEAYGLPEERSTQMAYDLVGNVIAVINPRGFTTSLVYDNRDRLVQTIEAVGTSVQRSTSMAYDSEGNLVSATDPLGRQSAYVYDALNRLTSMTEAVGTTVERTSTMAYDAVSNLVSNTDALGRVTNYVYNAVNLLVQATEAVGSSAERTISLAYDAVYNVVNTTDALGRHTAYAFDALNRTTSMTEAVGTAVERATTWAYDAVSNLVGMTNARGFASAYAYDSLNRMVGITEAAGMPVERSMTMAYDAVDNYVSTTDALGRHTNFAFDALNRMVGMTEAVGTTVERTSTMAYDSNDNMVSATDPLGRVSSYAFDSLDRMTTVTEAVGTSVERTSTFAFDAMNNLVNTTDPLGRHTAYTFDDLDRMTAITEAAGTAVERTSTFAFDAMNNLVNTTDPLGRHTAYAFDDLDRMVSMTEAVGTSVERTSTFAFDSMSNMVGSTDALDRHTAYAFDALDRMTSMTEAVGTAVEHTSTWAYDANSNLVNQTDALGRVTAFAFDALDRMSSMTEAVGTGVERTSTWTYDAVSNLATSTDALGRVSSYAYDALDRMTVMTEAVGTSVQRTSTFAFDAVSNMVGSTDALGRHTSYAFDALDRMTGMTEAVSLSLQRTSTWAYDLNSNLVSQTDALGRVTAYTFDALDRMTVMTEAVGTSVQRTSTFVYDAVDNYVGTIDALGRVTGFSFDALDRMTAMTEAVGTGVERTTTFAFDAVDNLINQTDALGRHTAYGFDALNRMVTMTEATGTAVERTSTFAFDAVDNLLLQTDPLGRVTSYAFDALNRMTGMTEAVGTGVQRTSTFAFDAVDNLLNQTDALGRHTAYGFDALNRMVTMTEATGTSVQRTSTVVYDLVDNVVARIDPLGHATSYGYDALDRRINTIDALNQRVTVVYDAVDNVVAVVNKRNFTTSYAYDALDRQTTRTDALNQVASTVYDAVDNVLAFVDERGNATSYAYDALNRQVSRKDALNHTTSTVYDAVSNVVASIDALGFASTFTYDALDRMVTAKAPSGGISTTIYDAVSNVVGTIDPVGNRTTHVYDDLDRRTQTIDARDGVVTMLYDAVSNNTAIVDPVGNRTTMVFDALNRLIERIDPLGNSGTMVYDADDRLTSKTDRNGRRMDYTYDAIDRETGETWIASNGTTVDNTLTFTYDPNDNLLTAADNDGAYTFTYDALDRTATQKDVFGLTLTFGYDATSNRTSVQDSLGGVQTSVYDAVNRLTRRSFTNGTTPLRADFTYTARDQVETVTRYSDLAGTALVGTSSYTYDSTGRMSTLDHRNASSTVLASYVYSYDLADRLTSESIDGLVRYYVYDATNQLTSDDGTGFTYDLNGNRNDGSYSAGPSNQLQTDGVWNYTYDDEGNTVKKVRISDGQTWTYGYDQRNMMVYAEQRATDGGTLLQRLDFDYDVLGNRIEKSVTSGSTTVQRFAWDGRDIWAELDGSSSLTTRRVFGDGVNEPLARIAGSAEWYLQDRMGSVRDVVNSAGTVVAEATYDAWGLVTGSSGTTDRYLAFGYQLDAESGLYYVMARYMDPVTHLWVSQDPADADINTYRYAGNSPTNATDPSGLDAREDLLKSLKDSGPPVSPSIYGKFTTDQLKGVLSWWKSLPNSEREIYSEAIKDVPDTVNEASIRGEADAELGRLARKAHVEALEKAATAYQAAFDSLRKTYTDQIKPKFKQHGVPPNVEPNIDATIKQVGDIVAAFNRLVEAAKTGQNLDQKKLVVAGLAAEAGIHHMANMVGLWQASFQIKEWIESQNLIGNLGHYRSGKQLIEKLGTAIQEIVKSIMDLHRDCQGWTDAAKPQDSLNQAKDEYVAGYNLIWLHWTRVSGIGKATAVYGIMSLVRSAPSLVDAVKSIKGSPQLIKLFEQGGNEVARLELAGVGCENGFNVILGKAAVKVGALTDVLDLLAVQAVPAVAVASLGTAILMSAPPPVPTIVQMAAPGKYTAQLGTSASTDYKATFFKAHPEQEGKVIVHHAIEQQVQTKFPGVVTEAEIHSLENLRGIPKSINSDVHLSQIRVEWNRFYKPFIESGTKPTKAQLLEKATEIDLKFGSQFTPPVGGK